MKATKFPPFDKLPKAVQRYIRGDIPALDALRATKRYTLEDLRAMQRHYPHSGEYRDDSDEGIRYS